MYILHSLFFVLTRYKTLMQIQVETKKMTARKIWSDIQPPKGLHFVAV